MKVKHIVGNLTPSNPEGVKCNTRQHVYDAARASGLYGTIEGAWESGSITANRTSIHHPSEDSAMKFVNGLVQMLDTPGVRELALEGSFVVTETGTSPAVYKIDIESGKVRYQKAAFDWAEPVTV